MAHVREQLQRMISEAATCVANDDLTGARDRFIRAANMVDVTVGSAPSLPADNVAGNPKPKTTRPRSKKAPATRRAANSRNRRRG